MGARITRLERNEQTYVRFLFRKFDTYVHKDGVENKNEN